MKIRKPLYVTVLSCLTPPGRGRVENSLNNWLKIHVTIVCYITGNYSNVDVDMIEVIYILPERQISIMV